MLILNRIALYRCRADPAVRSVLDLKGRGLVRTVAVVDFDRDNLERALERGVIDRASVAIDADSIGGADLVLIATPVAVWSRSRHFDRAAPRFAGNTLLDFRCRQHQIFGHSKFPPLSARPSAPLHRRPRVLPSFWTEAVRKPRSSGCSATENSSSRHTAANIQTALPW